MEFFGLDFYEVDVFMGIFIKSFGVVGGYIVGRKDFVDYLWVYLYSVVYVLFMSLLIVE